MRIWCAILSFVFVGLSFASTSAQDSKSQAPSDAKPSTTNAANAGKEYSGMYSFLKEGEVLQITVEDEGRVTGFVSRYGQGESDKGAFLDQFFRSGKLDGNKLIFATETVHGVWFDFKGTIERGEGKSRTDEGYYVLKGTLSDNTLDAQKKTTTHSRAVTFKMFPEATGPTPATRN